MSIPICHKTYLNRNTKILTKEGWRSYKDIMKGDIVLGISSDGYLILTNVLKKNVRYNVPYEDIELVSEDFKYRIINSKSTLLLQNKHSPYESIHICTGTTKWKHMDISNHVEDYRLYNFYDNGYEKEWSDLVAEEHDKTNPSLLADYVRDNYIMTSDEIMYSENIYTYFEINRSRCLIPSNYNYLPSKQCCEFFKRLLDLKDGWYENGFRKKVYIINRPLIETIQEMGIMCNISVSYRPTDIKIPLAPRAIVYEVIFTNKPQDIVSISFKNRYGTIWSIDTTTKYILCKQNNHIFMVNNFSNSHLKEYRTIRANQFTSMSGDTNLPIIVSNLKTNASLKEIKYVLKTRDVPIYLIHDNEEYQIEKIDELVSTYAMTLEGDNFSITLGNDSILPALNSGKRDSVPTYFRADEMEISIRLKSLIDKEIIYQELHVIKTNNTPTNMYSITLVNKNIREVAIDNGLIILTKR